MSIMNQVPKNRFFWIDDVLFGGILAQKANVISINREDLFYQMPLQDFKKFTQTAVNSAKFIAVHTFNLDYVLSN